MRKYYTYIVTNYNRTTIYVGMTNDLERRLIEHRERIDNSFTARYHLWHLIYFEEYQTPWDAIEREKQLKDWSRKKKNELIATTNPNWEFLNPEE